MDELITTKQVQDLLQVDRITIYRMLKDGRLKGVKVGTQWRFHREEIGSLMEHGTHSTQAHTLQSEYAPDEVLPVHCIQVIQDVFAEMNGIGSVTTDINGEPITPISNCNRFCEQIFASPSGRKACIESWRQLAQTKDRAPKFYQCHAGFQYARGRIKLYGQLTAIQVAGQFNLSKPSKGELESKINDLAEKHNLNKKDLNLAAQEIRQLSSKEQDQLGEWLHRVAETFEIIAHERADLIGRLKNISEMSTFPK